MSICADLYFDLMEHEENTHSTREGYTDNKALKVKNVLFSLCTYHRLHNVLRGFIMRKMAITALETLLWKELMRKQIGK